MFAGLSLAAVATVVRFMKRPNEKKIQKIKFLTQDGTLVEIDADKIPDSKVAATKKDIQSWVRKTKSL